MNYDKRVGIDFGMSVFWTQDHIYNKEDIKFFFDNIAACGVSTVYWRVSMVGLATYRSKVMKKGYEIDWDDYDLNDKLLEKRLASAEKWRYILKKYDPPEIAVREARRTGLKIYLWTECFDDYYPGVYGSFAEDEVCLAEAKDGRKMKGVMSYAWPEARRRRLSAIKELVSYGADGIYLDLRSHAQHVELSREYDTYGFEKPVADEFLKRYGIDIRKTDDFDHDVWHALKGEFFTGFLREMNKLIHKNKQKFCVGAMFGKYHYFRAPALRKGHVLRFENQWQIWAKEHIVDELVVGNGQYLWLRDPLWEHDEIPWSSDTEQAGFLVDDIYPVADRHDMKIYLWSGWVPTGKVIKDPDYWNIIDDRLQAMKKACEETSADGMLIHEADAFENQNKYELLKKA